MPKRLVSDNGPEFVSGDLKHWCESLEIENMESSTIYHSRANCLAERAVQTVKRANQACSANLIVSFGAMLQRALMILRNTSKRRCKNCMELMLGRKVRLPAVTDFDLCEPVLFKTTSTSSKVPATFITRKEVNTLFIQPENSNKTVLVSGNQNSRLEPGDIKTDSTDQESTDSQSENSRVNIDVVSNDSNDDTSVTEGEQSSGNKRTSTRNKNSQKDLEKQFLKTCKKRREDVIYHEDQNLEFKLKF